jgi:hypothetical protein
MADCKDELSRLKALIIDFMTFRQSGQKNFREWCQSQGRWYEELE